MYKKVVCPECNGSGFKSIAKDYGAWSTWCSKCNRKGFVVEPMTNGDIIRRCNNEQLAKVLDNMGNYFFNSFSSWTSKEATDSDRGLIFDFISKEEWDEVVW